MRVKLTVILVLLVLFALFTEEIDAQRRKRKRGRKRGSRRKQPRGCQKIPHVPHGKPLRGGGLGNGGDMIQYTCQSGFTLEGVRTITCINGQWTVQPRCVAVAFDCRAPPSVPFASPATVSADGSTATYNCLAGYIAVGSLVVECNAATQRWVNLPTCKFRPVVNCGSPPPIANGAFSLLSINQASYTCNAGFQFASGRSAEVITCSNGQWPAAPVCAALGAACSNPPEINNGQVVVLPDSKAYYTCDTGYEFSPGSSPIIACVNGVWAAAPTCVKIPTTCPDPPSIPNGQSMRVSDTQASYSCNSGYELPPGSMPIIQCVNKVWGAPPECVLTGQPDYCGPQPCGDETIQPSSPGSDKVSIGAEVEYNCISGYRIAGMSNSVMSFTSKCKSDGQWDEVPSCEPKDCGRPDEATNTKPVPVVVPPQSTLVGGTFTYECKDGYKQHSASLTITCQPGGMWTPLPECTVVTCPGDEVPDVEKAYEERITKERGQTAEITCDNQHYMLPTSGYNAELDSNSDKVQTVTCQDDGTWTQPTRKCFYQYPTDCAEYAERLMIVDASNMLPDKANSITIKIEPLQDGSKTANYVKCFKNSDGQSCSAIQPDDQLTAGSSSDCNEPRTAANTGYCASSTEEISYVGVNSESIENFLEVADCKCTQEVTWTCENEGTVNMVVDKDNMFLTLKTQGEGQPRLYNSLLNDLHATSLDDTTTEGLRNGFCDCAVGSNPTCNYCECSQPLEGGEAKESSITFDITSDNMNYLTRGDVAVTSETSGLVLTQSVEIGDIVCCK